jgi:flagellar basal-body rod modification protein FlgD
MDPISAITTASDIQMNYMKLLVAELQNQNPLEPLDNKEMAMQLAQFSQLQQLETMNSSFARVLTSVELTYANSLIGKEISFFMETETGAVDIQSGMVEQLYNSVDGEIRLAVNGRTVSLNSVVSVKN